ncbi:MAG: hypothetical protein WCE75_17175 [Terracidiphilus sp.]
MNRRRLLLPGALLMLWVSLSAAQKPSAILRFHTVSEPREGAFTMLIPDGWTAEGGVYRIDPSQAHGAGNSVSAKVDWIVRRDPAGAAMTHRLPDMLYKDMRGSPAGGMLPPGSNYGGMTVSPPMDAVSFLLNVVFRRERPQAASVKVVAKVPLPGVARSYEQFDRSLGLPPDFRHDTAMVFVTYDEAGAHFTEVLYTDIQYWGMGAAMWGNKDTYTARAPADEFQRLCPAFKLMNDSTKLNPQWIQRELQSQGQRSKTIADVQRTTQQLQEEMVQHRQQTNAEINHQIQGVLLGYKTETDPYTGKKHDMPTGDSQGQAAKVYYGPDGRAIIVGDPNWSPENDPKFANGGWKPAQE